MKRRVGILTRVRASASATTVSARLAVISAASPAFLLGSAALVALSASISACEPQAAKSALGYTADAKRAYEAALEEFDSHNWIEAQNMLREVKRKYSYSKYARLAELRIADADFEQDKFSDAIRGYRQFVHDHRADTDEVTYARSRIAESQYREIGDSLLLPAGEERDQGTIMDTYRELRGYLHDYPDAKESQHVRDLLADVTARLVRHELYVARFYLAKDNYQAAVLRVQYALRNFPTSSAPAATRAPGHHDLGLEPEALLLLGETYLKMHHWADARASFGLIVDRYGDSALSVQARNYLEYMHLRGV